MPDSQKKDPLSSFSFLVEVDSIVVGGFSDVDGLQIEIEVETYREGGINDHLRQFPGPAKYPQNLVLKRGITTDDVLWKWHHDAALGQVKRRNGAVILLDLEGHEKWRWNFSRAYPVKWIGPTFKANSAEIAIETVELVHEGLEKGPKP